MNKKGDSIINILVGVLAIVGGVLFIVNKEGFGLITISIGLLIEALYRVLGSGGFAR